MATINAVKGMDSLLKRMQQSQAAIGKKVEIGLKRAGLFLQAESQKIVPVHMGNLKASAFTRSEGSGFKTAVVVGYTAKYAVYVHENLEALHGKEFNIAYADKIAAHTKVTKRGKNAGKVRYTHKYWRPRGEDQQAKFLERPLRAKRREILAMVRGA